MERDSFYDFNQIQLLNIIRKSSFYEVCKAKDKKSGRICVAKILLNHTGKVIDELKSENDDFIWQLVHASKLNHPSIVNII